MKQQSTVITIVLALVAAGIGFYGGMKYQQSKPSQFTQQFRNGNFNGSGNGTGNGTGQRTGGVRNGGGQILGTILSIDNTSMTVKLADGSSKILLLSTNTTYAKEAAGAMSDLKVGDRVGAFGTTNGDGSVTAQSVQINPQLRMGGGAGTPKPQQ